MVRAVRLRAAAVAVFGLLALTACSSDDDDAAQSPSTTEVAADGSTAPTDGATDGATADDPFCSSGDVLDEDLGAVDPGTGSPDELRAQFAEAAEAVAEAEAEAPEPIRAAVATLARGFEAFVAALEEADFDFTQLSPSALTALDTPDLQAATEEIDAYQVGVCGASG